MHLTRFTDNALRCLTYLALHPGKIETVGTIARRMALSEDHLVKVVQRLAHLGYVETMRGRGGGVRLVVEPAKINVGAVVRATEEVAEGGEVTLNWIGQLLSSPLTYRQAEAKEKYGFECGCARCGLAGLRGFVFACWHASMGVGCVDARQCKSRHSCRKDCRLSPIRLGDYRMSCQYGLCVVL